MWFYFIRRRHLILWRDVLLDKIVLCHLPSANGPILKAPVVPLETLRGSHFTFEILGFWHLYKQSWGWSLCQAERLWQLANSLGDGTPQEVAPYWFEFALVQACQLGPAKGQQIFEVKHNGPTSLGELQKPAMFREESAWHNFFSPVVRNGSVISAPSCRNDKICDLWTRTYAPHRAVCGCEMGSSSVCKGKRGCR